MTSPVLRRSLLRISSSSLSIPTSKPILFHFHRTQSRRWDSSAATANPKLSQIVDQISTLTLLETADLVGLLKQRLNIPDTLLSAPPAVAPAGAAAAVAPAEEEEAAQTEEKTLFNVKLKAFEATSKPKIIKEIKALLGLSLVDSKKFVESATEASPKMVKEGLPKDEAEKMRKTLEGLGAKIEVD